MKEVLTPRSSVLEVVIPGSGFLQDLRPSLFNLPQYRQQMSHGEGKRKKKRKGK